MKEFDKWSRNERKKVFIQFKVHGGGNISKRQWMINNNKKFDSISFFSSHHHHHHHYRWMMDFVVCLFTIEHFVYEIRLKNGKDLGWSNWNNRNNKQKRPWCQTIIMMSEWVSGYIHIIDIMCVLWLYKYGLACIHDIFIFENLWIDLWDRLITILACFFHLFKKMNEWCLTIKKSKKWVNEFLLTEPWSTSASIFFFENH